MSFSWPVERAVIIFAVNITAAKLNRFTYLPLARLNLFRKRVSNVSRFVLAVHTWLATYPNTALRGIYFHFPIFRCQVPEFALGVAQDATANRQICSGSIR